MARFMNIVSGTGEVGQLPSPPPGMAFGEVALRFVKVFPGEAALGLAPFFHFLIVSPEGREAGHLNFRIGNTPHVLLYAGHIGYEVQEGFRGRRFALQACRAVAPFVRSIYEAVIITCDPDNFASIRTIELLGAKFLEEIPVAPTDPSYHRPHHRKRRYEWVP
jgi:predicted acetyltransferase